MIGVFGANGFIGRHLVKHLAQGHVPVRAVSRMHDAGTVAEFGGRVDFIRADFKEALAMRSALQDVSAVVQLVSTSSPGLGNDHMIADIEENIVPHVGFLQACIAAGVKRYIFISSGGTVYGRGRGTPFRESDHTAPLSSHGLTKVAVEKYIRMHSEVLDMEHVILRLANPYGPGQEFRKGQGLIPSVVERCRKGLPVRIFGDGSARRDYVYVTDVVNAIAAALSLEGAPRATINIGSGTTLSICDVVDAIENAIGRPVHREFVAARNSDVDVSSLDISLAHDMLGWSPSTDFRQGLARTLAGT